MSTSHNDPVNNFFKTPSYIAVYPKANLIACLFPTCILLQLYTYALHILCISVAHACMTVILEICICTGHILLTMTDLFTFNIMVGHVLPIQDEPCLFPTVTLKLLDFPRLTIHSIPPLEQQELKRKFHTEIPSTMSGSHNRIVFKKGKSCSFKLSKQDAQKLFIPLTVILSDAWCIPIKELARTCIDILIPHFKQESANLPVNSKKQIYELCNATGSKVAMIELSYKLKHIKTDVTNTVSDYKEKPVNNKEDTSKKEKLEKSLDVKEVLFPQKVSRSTDNASVNKLYHEMTICPPPLLFTAHSDNEHEKLQSELEPIADQDVNQVVWPNGYIHTGWNVSEEDNYDTALLPSCPQHAASSTTQDVSNHQNFWVLQTLVKELSAMELFLNSKGVIHPKQKCSDMCVQTENLTNTETDDKLTPTKTVPKKLAGKQKKFTRNCCATKLNHSQFKQPRKVKCSHKATPLQSKATSPRVKSMHQKALPRNKSALPDTRIRKIKIRSSPKQKPPPQILNSAVSRVSQITGDKDTKTDEPASKEFSKNASVKHKGDQSKLNLEIHLPAVMPSISTMSLKQNDTISNTSISNTGGLLTVPTNLLTPSLTPMASTIPLTSASHTVTPVVSTLALSSASQSGHLTQALSNDLQSYANLSLSQSSGDILNQSHISNLVFSTKHLEAIVADNKSTKDASPTSDRSKLDAISPTASNESLQYKDDFESSECSSKESSTSRISIHN